MTRWEYMIIETETQGKGWDTYVGQRARYVNGQELKDYKKGPPLHMFLNSLGQSGWEVTGMGRSTSDTLAILLKRQIP